MTARLKQKNAETALTNLIEAAQSALVAVRGGKAASLRDYDVLEQYAKDVTVEVKIWVKAVDK